MPEQAFVDRLHEQIGYEFAASQQYVAVAVYYDAETLPRLASFFYRQALEERNHALMMVRFLLDQDVTTAGRHPDSDIFLDDVTVSRRHAEFRSDAGEFVVVDVGSLNGTYVNREPVDTAVLANGDEVQIGKFRMVFLDALGGTA